MQISLHWPGTRQRRQAADTHVGGTKMDAVWDGITRPEDLSSDGQALRNRLADHARSYDWPEVLAVLAREPALVNSLRPGGASRFAPLHQAAHGGAPAEAVGKLIEMGAWLLLRNADGERP